MNKIRSNRWGKTEARGGANWSRLRAKVGVTVLLFANGAADSQTYYSKGVMVREVEEKSWRGVMLTAGPCDDMNPLRGGQRTYKQHSSADVLPNTWQTRCGCAVAERQAVRCTFAICCKVTAALISQRRTGGQEGGRQVEGGAVIVSVWGYKWGEEGGFKYPSPCRVLELVSSVAAHKQKRNAFLAWRIAEEEAMILWILLHLFSIGKLSSSASGNNNSDKWASFKDEWGIYQVGDYTACAINWSRSSLQI